MFKRVNYVNNQINLNLNHHTFTASLRFSIKTLKYVEFLKNIHYVSNFSIISSNNRQQIMLTFFQTKFNRFKFPYCKIKIISTNSYKTRISYKALLLLRHRTGNSLFLLLTSHGFLTHHQAIAAKTGGFVLGFFH
jgi:ribosomal protein S8